MYKIPASTLFVGKNLHFLPECASTNTYLMDLSRRQPQPEGTLVITPNQTAGRGQRTTSWVSEPGQNLTFSLALKPRFLQAQQQFLLSQAVAVALYDCLQSLIHGLIRVKWPNDILLNGKKVCGILIENQLAGSQLETSVVGIGLNVNQQHFPIPTATSLAAEAGQEFDLQRVLNVLCTHLEARYLQLKKMAFEAVVNDYLRVLHWRNEAHFFIAKGQHIAGTILGVDEAGRLMVETSGRTEVFDLKEITYLA